jgi:hypothetical protein
MSTVSKPSKSALESLAAVVLAATREGYTTSVVWGAGERRVVGEPSPFFVVTLRSLNVEGELRVLPCGAVEPDDSAAAGAVDLASDETILIVEGKAF